MSEESKVYEALHNSGYGAVREVLFGLECEIEALKYISEAVTEVWGVHEDGSLRNNGKEFVSPPKNLSATMEAFKLLHNNIAVKEGAFSERTSVHVHVNMQNLQLKQVKKILLLYALFEEFFFMVPDASRRANIHCVPLTETFLPNYYSLGLGSLITRWQKYTALNYKPLTQLGTIEFRHLHGTADPVLVGNWLKLIENLVEVGKDLPPFSAETLKDENIRDLFTKLFGHLPQHDLWKTMIPVKTFNQILDIKLSF